MKVYYLNYEVIGEDAGEVTQFFATQGELRRAAKEVPKDARHGAELEERELAAGKSGIIAALNGEATHSVLRQWRITARGGLEELS